ncbi:hypothetical protein SVIOM342S_00790 [Streptomyces violaceorubidus]
MAGTAALGLHLLDADASGSLGPMTAAVVALGASGSVTPAGDVSSFGASKKKDRHAGHRDHCSWGWAWSGRCSCPSLPAGPAGGRVVVARELLARVGAVVALFVAMLGGLARAGHDVVTIDGASLGLDDLPGGGRGRARRSPGSVTWATSAGCCRPGR